MGYQSSARGARPVRLLGGHTAEGALTARNLAAYFFTGVAASSHTGIDADETLAMVPYDRAAWTMRAANPVSDNVELCGFAEMTREQWLSTVDVTFFSKAVQRTVTVRAPRRMLDRFAAWLAERARARGIPLVRLTPAEVAAGKAGVIGHVDWTLGMRDGTHTDPGAGFPWDYVLARARGEIPTDQEDTVSKQDVIDGTTGPGGAWYRPFRGTDTFALTIHKIQDTANATLAIATKIATNPDVTLPEVQAAIKAATPTAEQIAASLRTALTADLKPALVDVVRAVLSEDNTAEADEIADRVVDQVAARLGGSVAA